MTEIAESHENNCSRTISDDPLVRTIVSLMAAMSADFGVIFTKQFPNDEAVRQYKRRLYQKFRHGIITDLVDGYELFVGKCSKYPPTIPELISCVESAKKVRLQNHRNQQEIEYLSALPPPKPTRQYNPLQLLSEAKSNAGKDGLTNEERFKNHEAFILREKRRGVIKRQPDVSGHMCEHGSCTREGTIAHSTTGGGNFYCATHFRQAG